MSPTDQLASMVIVMVVTFGAMIFIGSFALPFVLVGRWVFRKVRAAVTYLALPIMFAAAYCVAWLLGFFAGAVFS